MRKRGSAGVTPALPGAHIDGGRRTIIAPPFQISTAPSFPLSPPVIPAKAGIQRAANQASHANQARTATGQNQDLRDYRIFRILPTRL